MNLEIQIIGPGMSGKSTLAVLIEEALLNLGFEVEVEDIDLPEPEHRADFRATVARHMDSILKSAGKIKIQTVQTKR